MTVFVHSTVQLTVKSTKKEDKVDNRDLLSKKKSIANLTGNRMGEKRRQTLCDNRDMIV